MKFEDFIKSGQVKKAARDIQLATALVDTAEQDLKFLEPIALNSISSRKMVSNYYDILRSLLEADASLNGFKVYSHEAFTYYLKENHEENSSTKFERLRKIRNSINYYGKNISIEEAEDAVIEIKNLIGQIKSRILKKIENEAQ